MAHAILMPKMGMDMTEGTVSRWHQPEGALVRAGEVVAEVENNKITNEIQAEAAGRLRILIPESGVCGVGGAIGVIEPLAEAEPGPAPAMTPLRDPSRRRISPIARRLAAELAVPLAALAGSGPHGRIIERDVRAYQAVRPGLPSKPEAPAQPAEADAPRQPLSRMRQQIAERMTHSLQTTAQLTLTATAEAGQLLSTREKLAQKWGRPVALTALLVRAAAVALRAHPRLAAQWTPDGLVQPASLNLGVAVALADGLIVPVVRAVERLTVPELADRVQQLVAAAQTGQLTPDDVRGGHFTVTNLGQSRVEWFTPILNTPETAILGVGRVFESLALRQGQVIARALLPLSLTVDHRVVDGAPAAAFLDTLAETIETPALLLA